VNDFKAGTTTVTTFHRHVAFMTRPTPGIRDTAAGWFAPPGLAFLHPHLYQRLPRITPVRRCTHHTTATTGRDATKRRRRGRGIPFNTPRERYADWWPGYRYAVRLSAIRRTTPFGRLAGPVPCHWHGKHNCPILRTDDGRRGCRRRRAGSRRLTPGLLCRDVQQFTRITLRNYLQGQLLPWHDRTQRPPLQHSPRFMALFNIA